MMPIFNWYVKHTASGKYIASFAQPDIARAFIERGNQIGLWSPHELEIETIEVTLPGDHEPPQGGD